jgi:hypothetical protein
MITEHKENPTGNKESQLLFEGLERAYDKMLEFKKYKRTPVVMEIDGKIIEVDPESLIEARKKLKK